MMILMLTIYHFDMNKYKNKIINGDCLEVMKEMEDDSINLVLTDIPYGEVNRKSNGLRNLNKEDADIVNFDLENLISEFIRISRGSVYVFCGIEQVSSIRKKMVDKGLSTRLIIWSKTNPSPMNGQYIWLSSVECCVYGKKPGATFNEHCKGTVLEYPCGRSKKHPTQKPLDMFKYLIETSSNKGDIVLDPFLGSGTTAVASKELGRDYIGIELSEKYCEIARERVKSVQPNLL